MSAIDLREALVGLIQALRLPEVCVHDAEPDFCDGCLYASQKATAVAVAHARKVLAMPFTKAQIAEMRADVAAGAGHECSEWWDKGKCQLCDRPKDKDDEQPPRDQ